MKETKTLTSKTLQNTMAKGGCGECQTSCQSACKTSCTVGNQSRETTSNFSGLVDGASGENLGFPLYAFL